ncbi:hypothetical protein GN956_G20353 [Arapaima gigas]
MSLMQLYIDHLAQSIRQRGEFAVLLGSRTAVRWRTGWCSIHSVYAGGVQLHWKLKRHERHASEGEEERGSDCTRKGRLRGLGHRDAVRRIWKGV